MWIRCTIHVSLLSIIGLLFNFFLLTSAAKRSFKSFNFLTNKKLPYILKTVAATTNDECRKFCEDNDKCQAFAMSLFERKCNLYSLQLNQNPISNSGYNLYVITRTEDEGYYIYGTNYIKIYTVLANAYDANTVCKNEGGMLVAIKDDDLNGLIVKMMNEYKVFNAFIGVTDEVEEENWLYYDGTTCTYMTAWDFNGHWYRRDKNCAIMRPNLSWYQRNCGDLQYFICQIPLV